MKRFWKFLLLFAFVAAAAFIIYIALEVAAPVSSMIAKERDTLARSSGGEGDPLRTAEKLQALDFQLAVAYNAEDKPDKAITVLENMIKTEQAKGPSARSSRSYRNEARYYETMIDSCIMKKDEECAELSRHRRLDALSRAENQKRQEMLKEGKSMGWGIE